MSYDIYWPELFSGRLIKRYERFKADIILDDGRTITAHCPNSGSMKGCLKEGRRVYVSKSSSPNRKFPYTWEMIELPSSLVIINTFIANRIVKNAILKEKIEELSGYNEIKNEVFYEKGYRVDLLLQNKDELCLLEIKSCTLVEEGIAFFPDAPTLRGRKHLRMLVKAIKDGIRGVIFYLIQRMDAYGFKPACHIDPLYCDELEMAIDSGLEILVYDLLIDLNGASINRRLKFIRDLSSLS